MGEFDYSFCMGVIGLVCGALVSLGLIFAFVGN